MYKRYLVIDLPEGRGHLVGESASHDDHVSLPRRGSEHNAIPEKGSNLDWICLDECEPVHIISGGSYVHHLHRAAGEAKGERPE